MSNKNTGREKFYLLPNLLTTAGLFFGFYAIVASIKGQFDSAAMGIFIAMIFDGLDGRVARMTNTQSEFGAQYDSMADIVSFGVAPSLLVFNYALADFGKIGWLACFIYVACAALRLARFNSQLSEGSKNYFQGLPSPASAALLASAIWTLQHQSWSSYTTSVVGAILTVFAGLLMVSNFRYSAFKELNLNKHSTFLNLLIIVFIFVIVAASPAEVLFFSFLVYVFSGPVLGFKNGNLQHLSTHQDADFTDPKDKD